MELDTKHEEILETLWKMTEEKGQASVSLKDLQLYSSDSTLQMLVDLHLVTVEGDHVKLVERGRYEAENTVRRHRLAERLMTDVLDVKGKLMAEAACKLEHLLHKGIEEKICSLLGHPTICPHGQPIPPGQCCSVGTNSDAKIISTLDELQIEQEGIIAYVHDADSQKVQKLIAMGVLPGSSVKLLKRYPSYIFQIGFSQFAVDQEMAKGIYVRLTRNFPESRGNARRRKRSLKRKV